MNHRVSSCLAAVVLLSLLAVVYALGLTQVAGLVHDDVIYLVTAKALALGEGYRILSMPGDPWQVAYPPGYPALLAIVWKLWPDFPANLWAFKALNIPVALASLVVTYALVTRIYGASQLVGWTTAVLLALSMPFFTFMDLTMSEPLYILAVLIALWFLEPLMDEPDPPLAQTALLIGFLCLLPFSVRQVGLAVPVAVLGVLFLKRRWKYFAASAAAIALWLAPWFLWTTYLKRSGAPLSWSYSSWVSDNTGGLQVGKFVQNFFDNAVTTVTTSIPAIVAPLLGHELVRGALVSRGLGGLLTVLAALVVLAVLAGTLYTLRQHLRLFHLYMLASLLVVLPYPWEPTRYLTALAPFMIYVFVEGVALLGWNPAITPFTQRPTLRTVARLAAVGLILLGLGAGAGRLVSFARHRTFNDGLLPEAMVAKQADQKALVAWADTHMPKDALWLHERDPLIYLLTGRKAVSYTDGPDPKPATIARFEQYPTYMVVFEGAEFISTHHALLEKHPDKLQQVYQAPHKTLTVYKVAKDW